MSEKEPNKEPLIKREDPTILRIKLGKKAVDLTRLNATLYDFYPPWEQFRHIFREKGNEKMGMFFWNPNEQLVKALHTNKIPVYLSAEPCDMDIENYLVWQASGIDGQWEEIDER